MKKYMITAIMAMGFLYTPSFAQQSVQTKKEERIQKRADKKKHDINDTEYKMAKKQDKLDKKERKMHKKQRKVNAQQRSINKQTEVK